MKKILWFTIGVSLLLPWRLMALNGAQLPAFSAINESLGGSGVARPQDMSTFLINPAGITELQRTVNFNIFVGFPTSQMDTSPSALGNTAGLTTSNDDSVLLPSGGFSLPTSLFCERLYLGVGIMPVAGFSMDYPTSRLTSTVTANTYDSHSFYGVLKIVPTAAFKVNDQLSLGLGIHIDRAQFATNSAQGAAPFAETSGRDREDVSYGAGLEFGILYKPFDFLSAGVSYTTEQWMQKFNRYTDILPNGLNFPQQLTAGVSVKPLEKLFINTDFRWINWGGASGGFGTSVPAGGFGWQDQYIALIGAQYQSLDWLIVRSGYNYGRSAVPSSAVFASQIASPIGEHHLGCGLGFRFAKNIDVDFSYMRTFSHTMTDDGSANPAAAGVYSRQSVHQMNSEIGLRF